MHSTQHSLCNYFPHKPFASDAHVHLSMSGRAAKQQKQSRSCVISWESSLVLNHLVAPNTGLCMGASLITFTTAFAHLCTAQQQGAQPVDQYTL